MVPKLCHSMGARSLTTSLFLLSSSSAASRVSGLGKNIRIARENIWNNSKNILNVYLESSMIHA